MRYPDVSHDGHGEADHNPFAVPLEVLVHELEKVAREHQLAPLQDLLDHGFADLEHLRALLADMEDHTMSAMILREIDRIVDDYRRGVALV